MQHLRIIAIALTLAAAAGCGLDDPPDPDGASGSGVGAASGAAGRAGSSSGAGRSGSGGSSNACDDGETRSCVGPAACTGGQTCEDGAWARCDCGAAGSGGTNAAGGGAAGDGSGGVSGTGGSVSEDAGAGGTDAEHDGGAGGAPEPPPLDPTCSKAEGAITIAPDTAMADGDTFTLSDGVHSPVFFEFECFGSPVCAPSGGTGGVDDGNIAITFSSDQGHIALAELVVSAINDPAGESLGITATLETGGTNATVRLRNEAYGALGNVTVVDTAGHPGFTTSGMTGGSAVACALQPTMCDDDSDCARGCDLGERLCE